MSTTPPAIAPTPTEPTPMTQPPSPKAMTTTPDADGADHAPAVVAPPAPDLSPDLPPDHLANNPASPFFNAEVLQRGIGIRFKGVERRNVEEYCVSEGWVRVQAGRSLDRRGNPLTIRLNGPVEAWFEDLGPNAPVLARAED